ncbi:MAG: DNA repair protein RecN [Candidatus Hydrogenedentota bacterium]
MLATLRIRNYALIDEVEVDLRPGFNALTGETGAGKSILVGALNLVLGTRASSEAVRAGAKRATIDAVFRITKPGPRLAALLAQHEVELENDDELILTRSVGADGRSKAYVGGNLVPIAVLAAIGDELVDLHGQHEHQSLLKTDRQLDLLDGFAGAEKAAAEVTRIVRELHAAQRERAALETDDRERARQLEFLRFEVDEIDQAGLAPDEEAELRTRRNVIANAEQIYALAGRVGEALYDAEEGAASEVLGRALRDLEELAGIDATFQPLAERLAGVRAEAEEIAGEVRAIGQALEYDPEELERLNERLTLIRDLKRKYGADIAEVLTYREQASAKIAAYDQRDERLAELAAQCQQLQAAAEQAARALSKTRKAAAKKLERKVTAALQELGMKGGRFEAQVAEAALTMTGIDKVRFLLAANPGEPLRPLHQVASGGEVSRIMLALKAVFAQADQIPTLIFDEIDAGVGGTVAVKVAEKIGALAASHQVICITHIAQIAAVAKAHFHVSKTTGKKRTTTAVQPVTDDDRVRELARLLDGSLSKLSIEHARALLEK